MNKLITAGALALCLALASQQPAQAWVSSKFSVGLTWDISCGNNSFGWGLFQSGQVPTPPGYSGNVLPPYHFGPAAMPPTGMDFGPDAYCATPPVAPLAVPHAAAPTAPAPAATAYAPQSPLFHPVSYPGYGYQGYNYGGYNYPGYNNQNYGYGYQGYGYGAYGNGFYGY